MLGKYVQPGLSLSVAPRETAKETLKHGWPHQSERRLESASCGRRWLCEREVTYTF